MLYIINENNMIKRFEEFNLNEMNSHYHPFVSVLVVFDGDNMIDNAFYFEKHKDAQDAFIDFFKCAELIGDLSDIKSIDNEVIGFKCQNVRESETRIHFSRFLRNSNAKSDSFTVILYECEGEKEWDSYIRDLKMYLKLKGEKSDKYNEKI
jgi:hypothetical protein